MTQIIPAIDIINGKCVRLSQGDYSRVTDYSASPVDMARQFIDHGFTRLHLVDLDGAKAGKPVNLNTLESIASINGVEAEWGGGLKTDIDLRDAFNAGTAYAVIGSTAARQPELFSQWLQQYGPEQMVLGADIKEGKIAVAGWLSTADITIDAIIERFLPDGLSQSIVTDVSRDGMLQGPAFDLYTRLQSAYPGVDFTVSGGISSVADIQKAIELDLRRVIVGKAIYEGHINLKELSRLVFN
ncbi:MAG: 1-(5-phosphoribosyl)-5-[(5-phosphoribosylamino)methylideneamino]imidazole-4-carboxamide isomerase [Muribaculaceae bacterium]|nr:1-(5-phosphoribosyl)-5-[(5-phosphoribosylamino)methylideneamino]imidazole-4-carboxamide isomerase [Muribaculaceae bacterium]